ncbi:hypothetical protein N6H14_02290 [Paenibacillus sp. CC-CFT747]|nr:hypothetical protein N6H14_02290 [Paenibacillus sp. CC-CFT747]
MGKRWWRIAAAAVVLLGDGPVVPGSGPVPLLRRRKQQQGRIPAYYGGRGW